jgi:hypothetical protein
MGVQEALVTGIPGLKSETWGTRRVSRAESIWGAVGWGFGFLLHATHLEEPYLSG